MIEIDQEQPLKDILPFVKNWMKLLAEGNIDKACALLDKPNSYDMVWTPTLIWEIVNNIFSPETVFYKTHPEGPVFSDPFELEEQKNLEVIEFEVGSSYAFDYHVPLNGEWSDLTAQFEFYKKDRGYEVILHDLHVM